MPRHTKYRYEMEKPHLRESSPPNKVNDALIKQMLAIRPKMLKGVKNAELKQRLEKLMYIFQTIPKKRLPSILKQEISTFLYYLPLALNKDCKDIALSVSEEELLEPARWLILHLEEHWKKFRPMHI